MNTFSTPARRKQKRAYHRLFSGLQKAFDTGMVVRFLTLTSSKEVKDADLHGHFKVLMTRIRRKYGVTEYALIRTGEGNGVLHILYVGGFISQKWLSYQWNEIHQSPVVDIRIVRNETRRLTSYLVSHYLSRQKDFRLSYSRFWLFPGASRVWKELKKNWLHKSKKGLFYLWRNLCREISSKVTKKVKEFVWQLFKNKNTIPKIFRRELNLFSPKLKSTQGKNKGGQGTREDSFSKKRRILKKEEKKSFCKKTAFRRGEGGIRPTVSWIKTRTPATFTPVRG